MTRTFFRTFTIFLLLGLALGAARFNPCVAAARNGCAPMAFAAALPAANINQPYSATLTGAGGSGAYTFTRLSGALPNGITFNNGVFSGTPTQPGSFTVRIEAADENGCKGTEDFTLQVNCPTIELTPTTLVAGTYGAAYPITTLTVTGGFAPFTFSVTGLPAGMTFSTTGSSVTLGGTPTQSGSFNVVIKATDGFTCSNGANGRTYVLTINKVVLTLRAENKTKVAGAALPTLTHLVSGFVNGDTAAVLSGAPALTTTATASSNTGTYPITITQGTLSAANYNFSFINGSLNIVCPALIDVLPKPSGLAGAAAFALPAATAGAFYSTAISVVPAGGNVSFTLIASPNGLPNGLTLNPNTGIISGTTMVSGTFVFRLQATAFGSCTGSRLYSLKVNAAT